MPLYQHNIVISPSTTNDLIPVMQLLNNGLLSNADMQKRLKQLLPNWVGSFNSSQTVLLNRVQPTFRDNPTPTTISYYNATFSARLWNQGRVHAILLEFPDQTQDTLNYTLQNIVATLVTKSSDPTIPKQISRGLDSNN